MPTWTGRVAGWAGLALIGLAGCDDTQFNTLEVEVSGEGYDAVIDVVEGNCTSCHSDGGTASFLNLSEDAFCDTVLDGRLVVPGDADGSVLYQRITDAGSPMPPTGVMSEGNQTIVGDWIDDGADCAGSGGSDGDDGSDGGEVSGETVYGSACSGCHGSDGGGVSGPPLQGTALSADQISTIAQDGQGGMPAILSGKPDEADAVAQYILDTFAR